MSRVRMQKRLEGIETMLGELVERRGDVVIIVEGDRDLRALEALGVPGPMVKLNTGVPLLDFCESLAREHSSFLILTDWDRKGRELARRLERIIKSTGAPVDVGLRRRLGALVRHEIQEVEALDKHVERLRHAVSGPSGP